MKQDTQKSIFRSRRSLKKEIESLKKLQEEKDEVAKVWEKNYEEQCANLFEQGRKYRENFDTLSKRVRDIICSNYWSNDITQYMKNELFGTHGKITQAFLDAKEIFK